mmetsp:Transcript_50697/g.142477  ORF Transcript_50697/g.142477 Transcript_50697/m.142477 type:complete len:257 (+) Transcript_50697:200-970(+)
MLSSSKRRSSSMICNVLQRNFGFVSTGLSPASPWLSMATKLKLLMKAKEGRLRIKEADCLSSHGRPVLRSRKHSRMCTPGCPGKMMAVVCNVRCRGDVNTRVGIDKPRLSTSSSIISFAAWTWALPSSESGASWRWTFESAAFLAASTMSLNASLVGSHPAALASSAALRFARFSSMLCTACPCRINQRVFRAMMSSGQGAATSSSSVKLWMLTRPQSTLCAELSWTLRSSLLFSSLLSGASGLGSMPSPVFAGHR